MREGLADNFSPFFVDFGSRQTILIADERFFEGLSSELSRRSVRKGLASLRGVVAACETVSKILLVPSHAAKPPRKFSGPHRTLRNRPENFRDLIARCETVPKICGASLHAAMASRKLASPFRTLPKAQEAVLTVSEGNFSPSRK